MIFLPATTIIRKKLLLTFPNMRWHKNDAVTLWNLFPTTLCLLAAMVKDIVDIKIIDAQLHNLTPDEFQNQVEEYRPDFVGISLLTSEYENAMTIAAKIVKGIDANIIVIAGGVHITTMHEHVMDSTSDIDYCVLGEGEYVLRELLKHLLGNGSLPENGLSFWQEGQLITQNRVVVEDLTELPWPAYEFIDLSAYTNNPQRGFTSNQPPEYPFMRMTTTRGCPFGCTFCQVEIIAGKRVRSRDPEDVAKEILFLREQYGIRSIIFDDDNILLGENDYARRLFNAMINLKLNIKWITTSFALFLMTDEHLGLMQKSGCIGINVAIESGSERVLKEIIDKPIKDLQKLPSLIEKVKSYGIYCIANFIIGFPGETWNEIRETIYFAEYCGADYVKIFAAVPLYKTKLYNSALKNGLLECNDAVPMVDWRYGQINSKEWTSKDISILRVYEWDRINFASHKIKKLLEITGSTIDDLNFIRKQTRDSLLW